MARWLDVKNVEGGYGSVKIIHGIDMHVDEGEFVTIIGPNGCGKSTLIKIIFGIATYYGGKVEHKGEDVSGWRTLNLAKRVHAQLSANALGVAEGTIATLGIGKPFKSDIFLTMPKSLGLSFIGKRIIVRIIKI